MRALQFRMTTFHGEIACYGNVTHYDSELSIHSFLYLNAHEFISYAQFILTFYVSFYFMHITKEKYITLIMTM